MSRSKGPTMITLNCTTCGKEFERIKSDHLYSIKRGRTRVCCSLECARQVRRKPEGTPRRKRSVNCKERCFECNELSVKILHTSINTSNHRLRRKECTNCGYRTTTYEITKEQYDALNKAKEPNCHGCPHNKGSSCDLSLPEYMTDEAFDCIHNF